MIPFAVWHEGLKEGTGRWVLNVEAERFLLADDEGKFYWSYIDACKLVRIQTPEQPILVVPVQPAQQNGLVTAEPNRMMRRNGNN